MTSKATKFTALLALVLTQASLVSSIFTPTALSMDIYNMRIDLLNGVDTFSTCIESTYTDAFDTTTNTWTTAAKACYDTAVTLGTDWAAKVATPPNSLGLSTY